MTNCAEHISNAEITNELFLPEKVGEHNWYKQIRDNPKHEWAKKVLEDLYSKHRLLLDINFKEALQIDFFQRWAELNLADQLVQNGLIDLPSERREKGPDFILSKQWEGKRVCIEVMSVSSGTDKNEVEVHGSILPNDLPYLQETGINPKIIDRITSVLDKGENRVG